MEIFVQKICTSQNINLKPVYTQDPNLQEHWEFPDYSKMKIFHELYLLLD